MGKKQGRKAGNSKNKSASPPAKEHSPSPATDQSWSENDFDEMREEGFSPSNLSELKEELRTQRKETKNLEKRVEELTERLINAEKVINEMTEMKTMTREIRDKCTSFSNRLDQLEERVSAMEDQMNEMKREEKPKEKRRKRNEQSLQEVWDYVKRPNLRLIGVPESEGENGTKLENTLQDIIQENFPNLVGQANIQIQEIQRTPQRYSSRRATPRHIIARFTKVEMKEKNLKGSQRERSGYPQREAHQTNSRSLGRNSTSQKRVGANIQHS
uniref:LINE-1 retrotransposable element ORF1 protein n=1 Tax=Piliocolobus tephrosceles TaxID=591936 RepID=A0A8C9H9M4_9PRIM